MASPFQQWIMRVRRGLDSASRATDDLPRYLGQAVTGFLSIGMHNAAALAYYAIFSMLPLILLLVVVLSRLVGPMLTQEQIMTALSPFLPEGAGGALNLVQTFVAGALDQSGSVTIIAVAGLAWAGLGLFSNIATSLDVIFDAGRSLNLVRNRLRAMAMATVLILLLSLSFLSSFVIGLFDSLLLDPSSVWLRISAFALPLGLNMLIFILLFRFVPSRRPDWEAIWPAALLGAILWELAKGLFAWFVSTSTIYQPLYGAIASGMVLLLWTYILAAGFLFAAEVCARVNDWLHERDWQQEPAGIVEPRAQIAASAQSNPPRSRPG